MHLLLVFLIVLIALPNPSDADTRLLRQPDISATQVVFTHGGDLWLCAREGGEARRLTSFDGEETSPHFSPDGSVVAFSGAYDGNVDVYLVAVEGGEPQRLTWHPDADLVRGWTPDGEVLFASGRINAPRAWNRLWTMGIDEVMPTALPLQRVDTGTFFAGGQELAYQMVGPWDTEWRNYRGGQTQPIRIIELETLAVEKLPWEGSNDLDPVVLGEQVFFLSDRDLAMNVWVYDRANGDLTQRSHFTEFDVTSATNATHQIFCRKTTFLACTNRHWPDE